MSQRLSDHIKDAIDTMNNLPPGDRTASDAPFVEMLGHLNTFALAMERVIGAGHDRLVLTRSALAGAALYRALSIGVPVQCTKVVDLATRRSIGGGRA